MTCFPKPKGSGLGDLGTCQPTEILVVVIINQQKKGSLSIVFTICEMQLPGLQDFNLLIADSKLDSAFESSMNDLTM